MPTLVSPGTSVTVVDESAYASPGSGTIPLLIVATRTNKTDPTGTETDGIAKFTKKTAAGLVIPVTSQREITQFFGDSIFTEGEGEETSEYGLLVAYSYLGQGSQAYIVRADVDLGELEVSYTAPTGPVTLGAYWFDTDANSYGIHEWDGTNWISQSPIVEVKTTASSAEVAGTYTPTDITSVDGDYLVAVLSNASDGLSAYYYQNVVGTWTLLSALTETATFTEHYNSPVNPTATITGITQALPAEITATGHGFVTGNSVTISGVVGMTELNGLTFTVTVSDANTFTLDGEDSTGHTAYSSAGIATHKAWPIGEVWVKTTSPGKGIDFKLYVADTSGDFNILPTQSVENAVGSTVYIAQDGTSTSVISTFLDGYIHLDVETDGITVKITDTNAPVILAGTINTQDAEPTGPPSDGQFWYDDTRTDLDILVRDTGGFWGRVASADITYSTKAPSIALAVGDIWVDTSATERERPKISQFNGSAWLLHDNTDQTTESGILFEDFTYNAVTAGDITGDLIAGAPSAALYPTGMLSVNMALSKNTVRSWDDTASAWVNAAANHADGSGSFGRLAQRRVIANAMQAAVAGNEDLRDPTRNFTLLAAPNFPELADELVTLNSDRGETGFIILDSPMRKTPTEAVAWVQGVGAAENGDDGLVTKNTYSAVYYPAGRSTTPDGVTVTVPPSHNVLYTYAYNDNIAYQWFAPAGLTRGIVQNGSAVGYITTEEEFKAVALNQGQRDAMYINKLNPIATFPAEGVVIWGQKTLHPTSSALDRVNVARLVAYLRERFDNISRPFLFEPNDKPTRDRAKGVFDGFMEDILTKRGITDFVVVCDESNNTPARIDRNELYIDVAIEPTKAAEFIYIPIRLVNTGTLHG